MNQITLIVHKDWRLTSLYTPEAISHESIAMVAYPYVTDQEMEELRNLSTTPKRVHEILSWLTNLLK